MVLVIFSMPGSYAGKTREGYEAAIITQVGYSHVKPNHIQTQDYMPNLQLIHSSC
jgi:hypothetical protein